MKSFPIVLLESHGVTTIIGTVTLQDDVANQMTEIAIRTKKGFILNVTIDGDKREILEVFISNQLFQASKG